MTAKPKTRRKTIRWIKRIALIAGGLAIVLAIVRALLPQAIAVDTAVAERGAVEVEVREDGQTRVRDRYVISAPLTGDLERVAIEAGMQLDAGAIVARIQPPRPVLLDERTREEARARLAAARARQQQAASAVTRARKAKDYATLEAARTRTLFSKGVVSGAERDRNDTTEKLAIEDVSAAEHQLAAVASEVAALRAILEPHGSTPAPFEVVAPTRGRVLRVLRESAGPVAAGSPLVEIGDPASLEIVIDVLSRDAERIGAGMPVDIETGSTKLRGKVSMVEPSAFTRVSALGVEEQRVNVIVCFDAPSHLGDGFRVDARIVIWRGEDVLRVPASALFRDRGRWAVYVVSDGRAELRYVELGHRGRLDVEITSGVQAGERVIVHPSDQIHDATRVTVRAGATPA
jgi:HlyD family secretion protein